MCGIAGIISPDSSDQALLQDMTQLMIHRGPDASGFFQEGGVGLGHRRLSIIDLSSDANQPMGNEDGSLQLICNGEIYNYKDLTAQMKAKGHVFRSQSDCEVLLHLYEEYGDAFIERVNGMFSFAIWDGSRNRLVAAVDRFGKKPLYYAVDKNRLVFASELKSLLLFPWIDREIDPLSIDRFLSLRYVPAPLTIIKSIKKLSPASWMVWEKGSLSIGRYWEPHPASQRKPYNEKSVDAFEEILSDAVRLRLQSDVPLGLYLSGGVDSAAIGGLMRSLGGGERISYTAGFDYQFDEGPRAEKISRHLDYEFNLSTVKEKDFDLLPTLNYHLDEPVGDLVILPAYLLARKAKEKLTVVLTGDGADEILNGYFHQKIMILRERYKAFCKLPGMGAVMSFGLKALPCSFLNRFFDYPDRFGPREKLKLREALADCSDFGRFYEDVTSCFTPQDKARLYTQAFAKQVPRKPLAEEFQKELEAGKGFAFSSRLSLLDLKYWIPFSVLFRLDKMNMAHAVETRSPFLDYRVVEMALNLADEGKLTRRRSKEVLRSLVERFYPPPLREKGKQAFYMPMTTQYRERFFKWASDLLNAESVERRGLFNTSYIEDLFKISRKGSMLANRQLTALGMLEQWFRVIIDRQYGDIKIPD